MVIKSIDPMSAARIIGALYAVFGLIFGAFFTLAGLAGAMTGGEGSVLAGFFGVAGIIVMPILYGCLGFVGTLIFAWLYNVLAERVGGITIETA